jgi:hypothetical protein
MGSSREKPARSFYQRFFNGIRTSLLKVLPLNSQCKSALADLQAKIFQHAVTCGDQP